MSIKEVSETYGVRESLLRYYEKEGVLFPVSRKNGIRDYQENNLHNLEFVLCMRKAGMSMERLKRYVSLFDILGSEQERKEILEEQKKELESQIESLNDSLAKLNYKILNYETLLQKK